MEELTALNWAEIETSENFDRSGNKTNDRAVDPATTRTISKKTGTGFLYLDLS